MAAELSREMRLRKQAELQSLQTTLTSLREREASYIEASANIPILFSQQIDDVRHQIAEIENLLADEDDTVSSAAIARQAYADAFSAERAGDFSKAAKLYKRAARYSHPDASQAIRSIRYREKTQKNRLTGKIVLPSSQTRSTGRLFIWVAAVIILILILVFVVNGILGSNPQTASVTAQVTATATATLTPALVQLIVPDTPTPQPTATATATATPAPPTPTATEITSAAAPTATPTAVPTPMPAPRIIGPSDGLVWNDGAIVFEFERQNLDFDQLYCLNTLRGYDSTGTENWSYQPVGSQKPVIVLDANVFRVAKVQGMKCIKWSAAIGKGTCQNIIGQSTVERIIGLPRPCDF